MNITPGSPSSPQLGGSLLYRSIYLDLKRRITRGELTPATRIGTEKDLAQQYQVSVGTIRKTQDLLVQEGLLIKQQGRGTFVAPGAVRERRILWVCGLDVFDGDISPYYTQFLLACHQAGQAAGVVIEPAWLSHIRPGDSEPYMTDEAALRYAGFIFIGCEFPKHRLLRYATDQQLPHAHLVHWQDEPHGVRIDYPQGVRLGLEELKQRGCRRIAVLGFGEHLRRLAGLFRKLNVITLPTPSGRRMMEVEHMGYLALRERAADVLASGDGLMILDDILARGATRALLQEARHGGPELTIAVMSSRGNLMPLGLPVIHVVHDGDQAAQASVDLVLAQLQGERLSRGRTIAFAVSADDQSTRPARGMDLAASVRPR